MVNRILTATGLPYKESRFLKPPETTYAIYNDTLERSGADNINLISYHDVSIELYEYIPDSEAEIAIETQLDALGIEYTKQARFWIQAEQIYQVVYEFNYYVKGGL